MSEFRWALIGPGRIAHKFAEAVQRTPGMRLVHVLGRDAGRAEAFARRWARPGEPVPRHGTDVAALLADADIDAVYIATPHAQHAEAIDACLRAGRPVLCEKPLVATVAQARPVLALARERGVFLMEALWTRLLPLYQAMRPWLDGGDGIGAVRAVQSSFAYPTRYDPADRQWNPAAAGGALLDIGIYPLALTRWALERAPGGCPAVLRSEVTGLLAPSGVDQRVQATLWFEGGAVGQFVCGLDFAGDNGLRIQGERGAISVESPFWGATRARLERPGQVATELHCPFEINGFEYQLHEAARCIRAGLTESPQMPLAESLALAEWLDEARRRVGVVYPFDREAD
jgi:predicted dehydrogenase